jgi:hypothetical protein
MSLLIDSMCRLSEEGSILTQPGAVFMKLSGCSLISNISIPQLSWQCRVDREYLYRVDHGASHEVGHERSADPSKDSLDPRHSLS